jgi:hypothetical protein
MTRELRCRGKAGIDLRIDQDPSPRVPKLVAMSLRYERPERTRAFAQEGMGLVDYGVSIQNLPGTCTWNPWGFPDIPPEPGVVHFDLPRDAQAWLSPGDKDTTITAAANFPDVASLTRYLSDPERYWVFYVDDLTDVAISFGAWPRGGGLPAPAAGTGTTAHDPARPRDHRTSAEGTRASPSPAGSAEGPLRDASPRRTGAGDRAVDSSRQVVTVPGSRDAPGSAGTTRLSDARHDRRVQLRSGIRNVTVLPGPHGVRLAFGLEDHGRVRVQFSRRAPPWDDREGLWAYPAGFDSSWYAKVEWRRRGRGYEAVPRYDLKPGVRYYYLITVDGAEASSPTRQHVGRFTATVGP